MTGEQGFCRVRSTPCSRDDLAHESSEAALILTDDGDRDGVSIAPIQRGFNQRNAPLVIGAQRLDIGVTRVRTKFPDQRSG